MHFSRPAIVLALTVGGLGAQVPPHNGTTPHVLRLTPAPAFDPVTVGFGDRTKNIHMVPYPGKDGFYIVGMTARNVPTSLGGSGVSNNDDCLTGIFDAQADKFTPDNLAAALHSTTGGNEFGLTLHPSGLLATYESDAFGAYSVQIAQRKDLSSAWVRLGTVSNMPTANSQGYWDPALSTYKGQLVLVFMMKRAAPATEGDLVMAPLNLTALTIDTSKITVLVLSAEAGQEANSPNPIHDSKGELIGLSHHQTTAASQNEHYWSCDLDPTTPALLMVSEPAVWIHNGGNAAGTFYDNHWSTYKPNYAKAMWWIAGPATAGGSMEISAYCPILPVTSAPCYSWVLASVKYLATPLSIPPFGVLGLDPAVLLTFPLGAHKLATGTAQVTFPVPLSLKGANIPAQSMTLDPNATTLNLGNTCSLVIQ